MKQLKKMTGHALLIVVAFLVARWFFMDYLYRYSVTFFPTQADVDFIVPLVQIVIISLFLYLFLQSFFSKHIPIWAAYLFYFLYFSLLMFSLFFKNIGIQGFEANPLMFLQDFFTLTVFLNLILFLPLGFLCPPKVTSFLLFLCGITFVEISQYVFALGFFDYGDIITNTLGFIAGSYLGTSSLGRLFKSYFS